MIQFKNREAIDRAIAWAKANPTKIVSGHLAEDASGAHVSTLDPTATCFCLAGRIAHEAGIDTNTTSGAMAVFVEGYDTHASHNDGDTLWETNDDGVNEGDPLRGFNMLEKML